MQNKENEHLIFRKANFTDGNILLTECTHTIKITFSWSARA